jgi:hypothetical protein
MPPALHRHDRGQGMNSGKKYAPGMTRKIAIEMYTEKKAAGTDAA